MSKLRSSSSEIDLDRPNIEEYLTESIHDTTAHHKLLLRDLVDISPTLREAAGAIVDDRISINVDQDSSQFGIRLRYKQFVQGSDCSASRSHKNEGISQKGFQVRSEVFAEFKKLSSHVRGCQERALLGCFHGGTRDDIETKLKIRRFGFKVPDRYRTDILSFVHRRRGSLDGNVGTIVRELMNGPEWKYTKGRENEGMNMSTVEQALKGICQDSCAVTTMRLHLYMETRKEGRAMNFPKSVLYSSLTRGKLSFHDKLRRKIERVLVELMCSVFVASWTGVVRYHGPRPSVRPKQVYVANHTSMIDFIILEQMTAFAVIMQKHPGWTQIILYRIREHIQHADNNPLLIFPEGTCVNNHYTVMFKKGAFELDCTVCPIAIKYNKIFVDAFWNSRKVRYTISNRAGLKMVPWDGYLKYSRPSPKHTERKQQTFAESVLQRLEQK
ncbi:hypothetical protein ACLOJK_034044 [Asimina triloba]